MRGAALGECVTGRARGHLLLLVPLSWRGRNGADPDGPRRRVLLLCPLPEAATAGRDPSILAALSARCR